jgi:6-phosphogluconolactonase
MPRKVLGSFGTVILCGLGVLLMSCGNTSRLSGVLLATNQSEPSVNSYGINLNTGTLSQINTSANTGAQPSQILLDPAGKFAYVANSGSNNVSRYAVNANGTLTLLGNNTAVGTGPVALAMDQGGHFLFVANQRSNNISAFSVGSDASLSPVAGSPFATGVPPNASAPNPATPAGLAVTPSGKFLYVTNQGQDTISAFAVNSTSGALTEVLGSPFSVGTTPAGVTIDPTGKFLYATNQGSNNVSAFVICPAVIGACGGSQVDGSLAAMSGSPFSAGLAPIALAVEPSGNFLFVVDENSNELSVYRINLTNGTLTALTPPTATGTTPVSIAIHPQGNYLYVANYGSANISGYHLVVQSGVLGPLTPVTAATNPVGLAVK